MVKEEDFYNSTTKTIFQALLEMHDKEIPITSVSIIDYLRGKNLLDKAGGDANIIAYINSVKTSANAIYHAQLIKEKSRKRNLQLIFANLLQESANGDFETEDLLNKAENLIYQYATQQDTSTFSSIGNALKGKGFTPTSNFKTDTAMTAANMAASAASTEQDS